jgi:tetratricopeptide (TPR) repeat protein
MKKILTALIISFIIPLIGLSQSSKQDKRLDKAMNWVNKDKLDDAADYLNDKLKEDPTFGDGWDLLVAIRKEQYARAKKNDHILKGGFKITTKDKDGNEIPYEEDTLAQKLALMLNNFSPSKRAKDLCIDDARRATMSTNNCYMSAILLRNLLVDPKVDTNVCKAALKYYDDAEDEFSKKNYESASKLYMHAIEKQPDFYMASMYLGDAFYFMGYFDKALEYFKEAKNKFPDMLEPRKYIVDTYGKLRMYKAASDEALESFMVYPDYSMAVKYEDALYMQNVKLLIDWMPRGCLPKLKEDSDNKLISDIKIKVPWNYYKESAADIKDYVDDKGFIKTNDKTNEKYLELYRWKAMLTKSNDPSLATAKKMLDEGYLDCYVFITCFHIDIYNQYLDFVRNNKDKIEKYFYKYSK